MEATTFKLLKERVLGPKNWHLLAIWQNTQVSFVDVLFCKPGLVATYQDWFFLNIYDYKKCGAFKDLVLMILDHSSYVIF